LPQASNITVEVSKEFIHRLCSISERDDLEKVETSLLRLGSDEQQRQPSKMLAE
jgi:hypothetical protein